MKSYVSKIVVAVIMLAVCSLAGEAKSIIGVEGVYHYIDAEEATSGANYNKSTGGGGIRLGAESDEFRILLIFDAMADTTYSSATVTNATLSQSMITLNLDYFIPVSSHVVRPFIGAVVGGAKYKFGTEPSENDYVYGGEAGLEVNFNEHFSIDMFGRYIAAKQVRVNNYIQSGLGLNYKF